MGLDMDLKRISRAKYESIPRGDFWYKEFKNSEDLLYWRKRYDLHGWFCENTTIDEECSDEITRDKLIALVEWLYTQNLITDFTNVIKIMDSTDFEKQVIYYSYCN
jgi:hypothetical protein